MALDLSRVGKRDELKPRREPHWQRLRNGCFLGFRPSKAGGPGTWIARVYDEDSSRYHVKSLGDFGTLTPNQRFSAARREAERVAEIVEAGGEVRRRVETVSDACREYLRQRPGKIAERVFRRHVYGDPVAKVKLDKLRSHHLNEWRKRLEEAPAIVSRNKGREVRTRARALSTVNRDMAPLWAALNKVLAPRCPEQRSRVAGSSQALPEGRQAALALPRQVAKAHFAGTCGARCRSLRASLLPAASQAGRYGFAGRW